MDLSVIIPCLNKKRTIWTCVEKCIKSFENPEIEREIIFIDNGSYDNSQTIALSNGAKVFIWQCNKRRL